MTGTTDDRNDPGLREIGPDGMQATYLVLSQTERAQGFVRPLRRTYVHVGRPGPKQEWRDLRPEEQERYAGVGYVAYEKYPEGDDITGRFWTQAMFDRVNGGCGGTTTMGQAIAETYARDPAFYGGTFCVGCGAHFPVGADGEFVWADAPSERVGT